MFGSFQNLRQIQEPHLTVLNAILRIRFQQFFRQWQTLWTHFFKTRAAPTTDVILYFFKTWPETSVLHWFILTWPPNFAFLWSEQNRKICVLSSKSVLTDTVAGSDHFTASFLHAVGKDADHRVHVWHPIIIHLKQGFISRIRHQGSALVQFKRI